MFFWLQECLRHEFGPLRVFRYVSFRIIASTATALVICLLLYPWFIRKLTRKRIGETIRSDGPQTHLKKEGTPTMGGSLILLALVTTTLLWCDLSNPFAWFTLAITASFGVVGFWDDYKKLTDPASKGMGGKTKLLLQFAICFAVLLLFYWLVGMLRWDPTDAGRLAAGARTVTWVTKEGIFESNLYIPFVKADFWIPLPVWGYFLFIAVVIVGTSNAVNLTDGLDGLAIGPVIVAGGTLLIFCYIAGGKLGSFDISRYLLVPKIRGVTELSIICAAIGGAGVGFLWYNTYPASVFMGDVGALSLGGALASLAVLSKNEILSVILFGVFFLEAVSVITQTVSYKLTGKRVFKMAPIHHHFEVKGWPEPKIIVRFWIISIMLALIALASIKLR